MVLAIDELKELLRAPAGKLIGTHFACPDGLLSCVEFFRIVGTCEGYTIIPLEYKFLLNTQVQASLRNLEFEAVLDFGPVGKSIKYFADHHLSNTDKAKLYASEKRIQVDCFDAKAPSGVSVVDVLGKKVWNKGVPKEVLDPANRSDTATFLTESPTTWKEFCEGDIAWRYTMLVRTARDSPKEFVKLCKLVYKEGLDKVLEMEPYKSRMLEDIAINYKIKKLADNIQIGPLTFVIAKKETDAKYVTRPLMFRLYREGCKVVVLITSHENYYKVSFGVEVGLPEDQLEPYRVDKLAEYIGREMKNGGGHKRASASLIPKTDAALEKAITEISEHFKQLSTKTTYV